jgi:hypothetical protein
MAGTEGDGIVAASRNGLDRLSKHEGVTNNEKKFNTFKLYRLASPVV